MLKHVAGTTLHNQDRVMWYKQHAASRCWNNDVTATNVQLCAAQRVHACARVLRMAQNNQYIVGKACVFRKQSLCVIIVMALAASLASAFLTGLFDLGNLRFSTCKCSCKWHNHLQIHVSHRIYFNLFAKSSFRLKCDWVTCNAT